MTARDSDNDSLNVGTWSASDPNTRLNGSGEVGHANAPLAPGKSFTFNVTWTAPPSAVGDITFYIVGNAADGTNSTGDHIYHNTLTISERKNRLPPVLEAFVSVDSNTFSFTLRGQSGATYVVERSPDLQTWTVLGEIVLQSDRRTVVDRTPHGARKRFYRVRERGS